MARAYTTRFVWAYTSTFNSTYTVGASQRIVIRCITAAYAGTSEISFWVGKSDGLPIWFRSITGPQSLVISDLRVVMMAGEQLVCSMNHSGSLTVSGYLFEDVAAVAGNDGQGELERKNTPLPARAEQLTIEPAP